MRPSPSQLRVLVLCLAAGALAGCISLFPKQTPQQLYQFGQNTVAAAPAAAAGPRFVVALANTDFDRAASGERMLTVEGNQTAYIDTARWVSPAWMQFDSALRKAFDGGPAKLTATGEPARADYNLTLDVRTFEVRYDHGREAAPTIVIEVYAALNKISGQSDRERVFVGEAPASDNRVGAIVVAFDQALAKVFGQLVPWVNARGET